MILSIDRARYQLNDAGATIAHYGTVDPTRGKKSAGAMSVEFPDHPFWNFSLSVYMKEGVGASCIALQERHQLDVNVLLFCCWLGASGRGAASAQDIDRILVAVGPWHRGIVRPLRAVRTRMKGGVAPAPLAISEPIRRRLNKIEVDCEHLEQIMLTETIERVEQPDRPERERSADAFAGCENYLAAIGAERDESDRRHLAAILKASFGAALAATIEAMCGARR